jgi:1,4-dihydroxy-2-naphthoate octaprenyltransferase
MSPKTKDWIIATRPWAFPASTMPALIAVSYAFYVQSKMPMEVNWWYGVLAILGAAIFQASGNLISDYFDYKHKVDRAETFGSSRMLVDGVFKPNTILYYGLTLLVIGSIIGLYLLLNTSVSLLWIGAIGVLGTYFYYKLKFNALGDITILIIYGLLISLGTYLVATNMLNWKLLLIGAAPGFLIVNILHANNLRDIKHDGEANIKTQAMLLGVKNSVSQYIILGIGAYIIIVMAVVFGILHPLCLVVFLTFPVLMKNIKQISQADVNKPELIKDMDARSAQLVMMFSLLLAVSNFIAGLL